jgi:hypothetical protein
MEKSIPCEVVSRICGYMAPLQNWNAGKQQEYAERVMFRVPLEEDETHGQYADCDGQRAE